MRGTLLGLLAVSLVACSDSDSQPNTSPDAAGAAADAPAGDLPADPLVLPAASPPPIAVGGADVDFYAGVAYGADPAMKLDIFVQRTAPAAPLFLFIHGGGFTGGGRATGYGDAREIAAALRAGASYATIDYRLLAPVDPDGVHKPLRDCARALQFLRHHAAALRLDPTRVFAMGGSAGAGTSLWLAFHDDLADPTSRDPIARQSTRLTGAAASATQSTYDVVRWEEVLAPYDVVLEDAVEQLGLEQRLASFYGLTSLDQLEEPAIVAYRADVDMLALMSVDDPPFWVGTDRPAAPPTSENELLHHALHSKALHDRSQELGRTTDAAYVTAYDIETVPVRSRWEFGAALFAR